MLSSFKKAINISGIIVLAISVSRRWIFAPLHVLLLCQSWRRHQSDADCDQSGGLAETPAWSLDGRHLTCTHNKTPCKKHKIWLILQVQRNDAIHQVKIRSNRENDWRSLHPCALFSGQKEIWLSLRPELPDRVSIFCRHPRKPFEVNATRAVADSQHRKRFANL